MPLIKRLVLACSLASLFAAVACSPVPTAKPRPPATTRTAPAPQPAPAPAARTPVFDTSAYRLTAGDSVRIEVLGESELSLVALIDPAGNINYPFLGYLRAAGLTGSQLAQQIAAGLRGGYLRNPDVRVAIAHYRPVYVSGQVRQTGAYPYTLGLTVDQALTLAGGVTQFGSTRRIYVQRAGAATDQRERVELDSAVFPGDTIVVEERLF